MDNRTVFTTSPLGGVCLCKALNLIWGFQQRWTLKTDSSWRTAVHVEVEGGVGGSTVLASVSDSQVESGTFVKIKHTSLWCPFILHQSPPPPLHPSPSILPHRGCQTLLFLSSTYIWSVPWTLPFQHWRVSVETKFTFHSTWSAATEVKHGRTYQNTSLLRSQNISLLTDLVVLQQSHHSCNNRTENVSIPTDDKTTKTGFKTSRSCLS